MDTTQQTKLTQEIAAGTPATMEASKADQSAVDPTEWFAIKTRQDFKAEEFLKPLCEEVYFPTETVITEAKAPADKSPTKKKRERAIIPRVLFIKTTEDNAIQLERAGRAHPELSVPFWIYRYPTDNRIQVIPESSIRLLKLLTANDTTRCEVFTKKDFRENQRVRVTGGPFKGYEGFVQRVRKNKHVVVKIEGVCMVLLPFIHPDLLQAVEE